jgi:hypothetical protein
VDPHVDEAGDPVLLLRWRRELVLTPRALFEATAAFRTACRAAWVQDEGWTLVRDER